MKSHSNQLARLYRTDKTHKFDNLKDTTVANLKFQSIIDQIRTFTCNAAKVLSHIRYLKPLYENEYSINDNRYENFHVILNYTFKA